MKVLRCVNIPTTNIETMREFYAMVFETTGDDSHGGPNRVEFQTGNVMLVLCRVSAPPVVHPESCGLEFGTENIDAEYERLKNAGVSLDGPPVTYPWGWWAFGFRDPDGNHYDFVEYVGGNA